MIAVLFLSIPPTLGKILVLKIKENQSRILIGETKNRRPIIGCFFSRAYVGITRGLPSIVMADQNNNVVWPSDYFKLIINEKSSIRKINLRLSINEVIEEVLDVPAAITKASCHGIDTKEGNDVEPSVTFEVLKSFGFVVSYIDYAR